MKALVVLLFLAFALVDGAGIVSHRQSSATRRADWEPKGAGTFKGGPKAGTHGADWEPKGAGTFKGGPKAGHHRVEWEFEDWKVKIRSWDRKPLKRLGPQHGGDFGQQDNIPQVRWCVTNPCEMEKCRRMTTEFNYMVNPRMHWSCVMASCKKSCMEEIQHGHADIMTAEGEDIYTAGKKYDLKPIMSGMESHKDIPDYDTKFAKYEEPDGSIKHYTIALVKKTNLDVNSWQDMDQRKSCHSGMDSPATFKSPVCSLIQKNVIPCAGNVFESAGEFFKESCVPGVQLDKYNPNMTNPESLCKLCKGPEDDDFCETLSDKEPYYGFTGSLKCLRDGAGDVAFVHTHDVMTNYDALYKEFDVVCKNTRLPLDWDNVVKADCHLTEEHPQVLMVSSEKPRDWIKVCTNALTDASTRFSTPGSSNAFSMFDSTPYCTKAGDKQDEQDNNWNMNWMKNKDVIFKDHTSSLVVIPQNQATYKKFLGDDTTAIWKTCAELKPKPRAFICVVGDDEMKKCQNMISKFQTINEVKTISWGCIEAMSKKECVEMVAKNLADIVDQNATEMFMAGWEYNLAPFMAENYKGKDPMTESITIGVMVKDNIDLPEDMRGLRMCNAGVHKISGFLHPMGWLLANGTIKRSSSPLKSIGHHFDESCVPGMNTLDLTKHPLLSRTLDWRSMIKDKIIRWEDWYEKPLWRKWQDNSDQYHPMHDMQSFDSPEFSMMIEKMTSENPRAHAHHTPEIHEAIEMLKKDFSWNNYDGLENFYNLPVPKWKMISWVWQKPEDWTEPEWNLFNMWAEQQWDQKEDWASYTDKWTVKDWETFKSWIDAEHMDYTTDHKPLHKDAFIRLSVLCSRHHWLMDQWTNIQWDNVDMKHCRENLCEACAGQEDDKCSMDPITEKYYDYQGALKCLERDGGDVAFMDAYTLDDAITKNGFNRDDFVLLCPDRTTVDYNGTDSIKECNFGRVPSHALVTCNMHDGVWRWKVTKALLEAQKVLTPQELYQDGIFNKDVKSLTPISFVNQTYQVWLGPMFLRAMEGLMQPPVKGWDEEFDPTDECEGEECVDDVEDRPPCDECMDDDAMCMENCWTVEPTDNKPPKRNNRRPRPQGRHRPGMTGGKRRMGGPDNRRRGVMPHKKPKKTMRKRNRNMLWKPKGRKMHPMMGMRHMGSMKPDMMNMGPMKRQGMRPMGSPPYGAKPMMGHPNHMNDMKPMPGMMHPDKSMGPMMHGKKPWPGMMHPGKYMHGKKPMPEMMHPDKFMHGMKPMKHGMDKMHMMGNKMMGMGQWRPDFEQMMPMKHGMMGQGMMMDKPMRGHRMMPHQMETGPILHSRRSPRGEFYSKVVFMRNGTCNAIIPELKCFGEKRHVRMRAGRVDKTPISVPMCHRITIMKETTAQFTCDTGASFLRHVLLPVKCAYLPCNPGFWLPDWSNDEYWNGDNSYTGDYWGNKDWWNFDQRDDNKNWFLENRKQNRVGKTKPWSQGGL